MLTQSRLFTKAIERPRNQVPPFKSQLLKWVGNKQRFAHEIISYFPADFGTYYEPFLGTGAVLATLAPEKAVGSDVLEPLVQIFQTLLDDPRKLLRWYETRWTDFQKDRNATYRKIQARYSKKANAADLVFLSRSCYGGVIRFRKDGYISTPIGVHAPISPASMKMRVDLWRERLAGATFVHSDFEATIDLAQEGDVVYCDPPYYDTQSILYGAQSFSLERLYKAISSAKARGAYIALSIDGHKKSGTKACDIPLPEDGLFERALAVNCGRSMLKRFQMEGKSLESEVVSDRLLLSWS